MTTTPTPLAGYAEDLVPELEADYAATEAEAAALARQYWQWQRGKGTPAGEAEYVHQQRLKMAKYAYRARVDGERLDRQVTLMTSSTFCPSCGRFGRTWSGLCRPCTIVAQDVLAQADLGRRELVVDFLQRQQDAGRPWAGVHLDGLDLPTTKTSTTKTTTKRSKS